MLYEKYEKKIKNIAQVKGFFIKYKIAFIVFIALLFVAISGLSFSSGMIIDDLTTVSSIEYGEQLDLNSKVLFKDSRYEFRRLETKSNDWTSDYPILPGNYEVRVVSSRMIFFKSKGTPVSFSINAKETSIEVYETSLIYGDEFTLKADLNSGDYFVESNVLYEDFKLITDVTPDINNIKILNNDGVDVTTAYDFNEIVKEVQFIPRVLNVNVINKEKIYDGQYLTSNEFEVKNLLDNHIVVADIEGSIKNYGVTTNEISNVEIYSGDTNITYMYNIITTNGFLEVNKRDVTITSNSATQIYNGEFLENTSYSYDNVVDGETIDVVSNSSIMYYGVIKNEILVNIYNDENINNYNIKYNYGNLEILKRDITITTSDASMQYDGSYLYNTSSFVTKNNLVNNDVILVLEYTKIKYFGTSENILDVEINNNGKKVSDSYNIKFIYGVLEITKREAIISTPNETFMYNDKEQFSLEVIGVNIIDSIKIISETRLVDVSSKSNIMEVELYDGTTNVDDCYELQYIYGTISVTKRILNIDTKSGDKEYDGTPLMIDGWQYSSNNLYELIDGHILTVNNNGSITNVDDGSVIGEAYNTNEDYTITKNGKNILDNYEVNISFGILIITRRQVTVLTNSDKKVYDDTVLVCNNVDDYTVTSSYAVLDHEIYLNITGSALNVVTDEYNNVIGVDNTADSYYVLSGSKDVSKNYDIKIEFGTLTITHRLISVASLNAEKMYDGLELRKNGIDDWEYLGSGAQAVDGHIVEVSIDSFIIDYGTQSNSINEVSIYKYVDGNKIEVSSNYGVTTTNRTLKITKRPIYVSTDSASKEYDDTALTKHTFTHSDDCYNLVLDHVLEIHFTGTITNPGTVNNSFISFTIKSGSIDKRSNYSVEIIEGILTVTKREVVVTTSSNTFIYNGEVQYDDNYTVNRIISTHTSFITNIVGEKNVIENGTNNYDIIIKKDGVDVSAYYDISYEYGKLNITARIVSIKTSDKDKIYDGTKLEFHEWDYLSDLEFVSFHTFDIVFDNYILDVLYNNDEVIGVDNTISSYGIYDGNIDVKSNYIISIEYGTLIINPREVDILISSKTQIYDAEELTYNDYTITSELKIVQNEILNLEIIGSILNVGSVANTYNKDTLGVTKENGSTSTTNYNFTITDGKLTITHRVIELLTGSASKIYNGTVLEYSECHYKQITEYILDSHGHTLDIKITGSIINVGTTPNTYEYANVLYENGDINDNYIVNVSLGTLTVFHRKIHLITNSDSKVYDGSYLFDYSWDYKVGSGYYQVVSFENIDVSIEARIINFGTIDNIITNVTITSEDGVSTIDNYIIEKTEGILEITKRDITITSQGDSKVYDGHILFNDNIDVEELSATRGIVLGDYTRIYFTTEIYLVSNIKNVILVNIYNSNDEIINDNYEINYIYNYLAITVKDIIINTLSESKVYDSFELFNKTLPDVLAETDSYFINDFSSIRNFGEIDNIIDFDIYRDDELVTFCYQITISEIGKLSISQKEVIFTTGSDEKVYNNQELICEDVEIDLATNDRYEVTSNTSVTYFTNGKISNVLTILIFDEFNNVVNNNYILIDNFGTLEIFKKEITITSGTNEFIYDGNTHKEESYEEDYLEFYDSYTIEYLNSVLNVVDGKVSNEINVEILNELAVDSYDITKLSGTIEIIQREIVVNILYSSKYYDGVLLSSDEIEVLNMVDGENLSIQTSGSIVNAGVVDNIYVEGSILFIDALESNYSYIINNNKLEILPKVINITTNDLTKYFTGNPIFDRTIIHDDLIGDDKISYDVTGSQTAVGSSLNTIDNFVFEGISVGNYEFKQNLGTLTVVASTIYIHTGSDTKEYDGDVLQCTEYYLTDADGNSVSIQFEYMEFSVIINVGTKQNLVNLDTLVVGNNSEGFTFAMAENPGILEITKRNVEVTTRENLDIIYNGEWQSYTYFDVTLGSFIQDEFKYENVTKLLNVDNIAYLNIFDILVYSSGEDLTYNYNISYVYKEIKLIQRDVYIYTNNGEVVYGYNGYAQSIHVDDLSSNNLVNSHELDVTSSSSLLLPSEIDLSYCVAILADADDVSYNYNIIYAENEKLIITKAYVLLTTETKEFTFNGQEHFADGYEEIKGFIANTDTFRFIDTTRQIKAGVYVNEYVSYELTSIYEHLIDIDDLYQIEIHDELGSLIIKEADITIVTATDSKVYDGEELKDSNWDYVGDVHLPDDYELVLLETTSITDVVYSNKEVAKVINDYTDMVITDELGNDVTSSFNVGVEYGTLLITPRLIEVIVSSIQKPPSAVTQYETTHIDYKYYSLSGDTLGNVFTTNALESSYTNSIELIDYTFIKDSKDNTLNFEVKQSGGIISYSKRTIVITADSLTQQYTGDIYYIDTYTIEGHGVLPGHTIEVGVAGYRQKLGTTTVKITSVSIKDANGVELVRDGTSAHYESDFYDITIISGFIKIY